MLASFWLYHRGASVLGVPCCRAVGGCLDVQEGFAEGVSSHASITARQAEIVKARSLAWTARCKLALVLEIIEGKTIVAAAIEGGSAVPKKRMWRTPLPEDSSRRAVRDTHHMCRLIYGGRREFAGRLMRPCFTN